MLVVGFIGLNQSSIASWKTVPGHLEPPRLRPLLRSMTLMLMLMLMEVRETPRFYVPHSLALRLTANDNPQAWRDLSPDDQETYLTTVENFVRTHQETPQEHWGLPDTHDDYQGQAVPNNPYKADYRYPRWAHNEALIAVDLTLAIADSCNPLSETRPTTPSDSSSKRPS